MNIAISLVTLMTNMECMVHIHVCVYVYVHECQFAGTDFTECPNTVKFT